MTIYIPTLSTQKWVSTPEGIIDRILAYYIASNPSQTFAFINTIASLQAAIKEGGGSMSNTTNIVQDDLTAVFSRYFPEGASISCDFTPVGDSAKYNIDIQGSVMHKGQTYNIAKALHDVDSIFKHVGSVTVV